MIFVGEFGNIGFYCGSKKAKQVARKNALLRISLPIKDRKNKFLNFILQLGMHGKLQNVNRHSSKLSGRLLSNDRRKSLDPSLIVKQGPKILYQQRPRLEENDKIT